MSPVFFLILGIILIVIDTLLALATAMLMMPIYVRIKLKKRKYQLFIMRLFIGPFPITGLVAAIKINARSLPKAAVHFRKKLHIISAASISKKRKRKKNSPEWTEAALTSSRIRSLMLRVGAGTGDAAKTAILCGILCIASDTAKALAEAYNDKLKGFVIDVLPYFDQKVFFIEGDCIICIKAADIIKKIKEQKQNERKQEYERNEIAPSH